MVFLQLHIAWSFRIRVIIIYFIVEICAEVTEYSSVRVRCAR